MIKNCQICKKSFQPHDKKTKYCSLRCFGISQRKKVIKICLKCKKKFEIFLYQNKGKRERKYCSKKCYLKVLKKNNRKKQKGKNPRWKGNEVSYKGLHKWIRDNKGRPKICEHCGSKHQLNWANKSGKYLRDLNDWISLCILCHRKYDKKRGHRP